jgi:hypothetical protein
VGVAIHPASEAREVDTVNLGGIRLTASTQETAMSLRIAAFVAFIGWMSVSAHAEESICSPPEGFEEMPVPSIAAPEELASHTEEVTIARPLAVVRRAADRPLEDIVAKTSSLPSVSGDYLLTPGEFGRPGSRRITCLTDGSTLQEQALERAETEGTFHFRYVVWNYTSEAARPVQYGVGDFLYADLGDGRTRVIWTYSFKLKEQKFPGYLGSFGRVLFRVGFLEREYAAMMRGTLNGTKEFAEAME